MVGKMIKKILVMLLFAGVAFSALSDLSNASNYGCEDNTGVWRCHQNAKVEAYGKFMGELACFSTQLDSIDNGCFATVALEQKINVNDCTYSAENRTIIYNPCENVTLNKGDLLLLEFNPEDIDISKCDRMENDSIYGYYCPFDGKTIKFSGLTNLVNSEEPVIVVVATMEVSGFDLWAFILDNLIYIILIGTVIVIAYWVFAPHKQVIKKESVKETKKESVKESEPSKRERRYGRKA
jgi:hypothetical protein